MHSQKEMDENQKNYEQSKEELQKGERFRKNRNAFYLILSMYRILGSYKKIRSKIGGKKFGPFARPDLQDRRG